jgi:hypothetical protein
MEEEIQCPFESFEEWREYAKSIGKHVSIGVCWGLTQYMKKYNLTFKEAYIQATKNGTLIHLPVMDQKSASEAV